MIILLDCSECGQPEAYAPILGGGRCVNCRKIIAHSDIELEPNEHLTVGQTAGKADRLGFLIRD